MPKSFSAIFHRADKLFEVIYTAYKPSPRQIEVADRQFSFILDGSEFQCNFGESSADLLNLSKFSFPRQISETRYRNIQSFSRFSLETDDKIRNRLFGKPTSFFVSGVENCDDEYLRHLISNLNFYMSYFDLKTPRILIHEDAVETSTGSSVRYRENKFPKKIDAKAIDENLLSFWSEAFAGDEIVQFMLYYRIIEYASTSYSSDLLRKRVIRAISRPSFRADFTQSVDDIIELLNASDTKVVDGYQRFMGTLTGNVMPEAVWSEISKNQDFFSEKFECDGGFVIEPLISKDTTLSTFSLNGVENFGRRIKDIRNVLSHGKDFPRDGVFRPTKRNLGALRPWIILLELAAGEVVLSRVSR